MVSKNQFQKFFQESIEKEPREIKSKYFQPRRNFYYLREDDNINACRHTSKWCFLQDNYKYQFIEKECYDLRTEDFSLRRAPLTTERKHLVRTLRRNNKRLNKPFQYSKGTSYSSVFDLMLC